jgi:Leucine-rich repeat (LRR) protein
MMSAPKEAVMRLFLRKLVLAAVIALLGSGTLPSIQSKDKETQKAELDAAAALTRLGVPLQRDSRGVIRWIEATKGEINDEALRHLPALSNLEWLEIGSGTVTRSGMASLKNCPSLRRLYVHDIDLSGDALEWLASLTNLEALSLQRTGIDGAVLKNLKAPALTVLNLSGDKIVNDDMSLITAMKGLEVLALADTKVTGDGIAKLEGMSSLNELNIMNDGVLDGDLEHFLTMPNLRIVYASGCSLNEIAIQSIVGRFPMLAIFR